MKSTTLPIAASILLFVAAGCSESDTKSDDVIHGDTTDTQSALGDRDTGEPSDTGSSPVIASDSGGPEGTDRLVVLDSDTRGTTDSAVGVDSDTGVTTDSTVVVDRDTGVTTDSVVVIDSDTGTPADTGIPPFGTCALPDATPVEIPAALSDALNGLQNHLDGSATLSEDRLLEIASTIETHAAALGAGRDILAQALSISAAYEEKEGPLFINAATQNGFARGSVSGIHQAAIALQQGLIDYGFADHNVERFEDVIDGAAFQTSAYFPGAVDPSQIVETVEVQINASYPETKELPVLYLDKPARRPTGTYLVPGTVATIAVPDELVNAGYSIRVGAHSWDLQKKSTMERLDRVSIVYPITCNWTKVANPLGGGIYIEAPYGATAGIVTIKSSNVVRAPFFRATSFAKTTNEEWFDTVAHYPAPWADFESDKFMMQVPSPWLSQVEDAEQLMADWDQAMDAVTDLFGRSRILPKTVLYVQVDATMRGNANFPGYPQSNYPYKPEDPTAVRHKWMLKGPQLADWTVFHELGHASNFTKIKGEVEAAVNLPYVAIMNTRFGVDLDVAFGNAINGWSHVSLDDAAVMWMVTENFRQGNPMNISNQPGDEVKYQHRGFGKYVAIVKLFGWEALQRFWRSVNEDYMNGIVYPTNADPTDSRILRMSRAAGVDLTPLIHFWGVQPDSPDQLAADIAAEGLPPSAAIYDELNHYKDLIPMNNAEFLAHANHIYPNGLESGANQNPLYGIGWYYVTASQYSEADGIAAQQALQNIIDHYFPNGRP